MKKNPLSMSVFARLLLNLCDEKIHHDPESPAAKDAAERIEAAFAALHKGQDFETIRWAHVVYELESARADDAGAVAAIVASDPGLAGHDDLVAQALAAWRADHGKWDATLRLLDAAGLYKNPPRRTAEKPSELLRQRFAQERRKGVPLAFRPLRPGE